MMRNTLWAGTFVVGLLFSLQSWSAALIESASGDVRAGISIATARPVGKDQRIQPGTVVTTGPRSLAILRFDDGQTIALGADTDFKVSEYAFSKDNPTLDRFVFDLLKGAMRSATALVGRRAPASYVLRTPQSTIGIRGTDFMVAVVNPSFVQVLDGAISVGNNAGSVVFTAGQIGTVATTATLASSISVLPAPVAATFSQLGALPMGATAGAAQATGAATGGLTGAAAAAIAIGIAAVAAIANDNDGQTPSPSATATTGTR